jgi:hypothetical protein
LDFVAESIPSLESADVESQMGICGIAAGLAVGDIVALGDQSRDQGMNGFCV